MSHIEHSTAPVPEPEREFTTLEGVAFMISGLGVQLSSELYAQWGTFFYSPSQGTNRIVYVSLSVVAVIFMAGRAFDVITDPLIGLWSDRTRTQPGRGRLFPIAGRRRPFIFWGSLLMTVTGIAFWYPPVAGESNVNLVYATVLMSVHWGLYTLAYIPLLALAPEIARTQRERVRLGTWIAVGMTVGLVASSVLPGALINILDPARAAALADGTEPVFSPIGYQRVAVIFAVVSLASFQFLVWAVRERHVESTQSSAVRPLRELSQAVALPVFRIYIFVFGFFYMGLLAMQRAAPYWAVVGLGGDESTMTTLGVPFMIVSLLSVMICPWLGRRFELKWLVFFALAVVSLGLPLTYVIAKLNVPDSTKVVLAMVLYGSKGIGLGFMYVLVTPLMGEIIDQDAERFGARREAVFNSLHAVMVKSAQIISILIATTTMDVFGNSVERPTGALLVGPIGGAICLVGLAAALFYPVLNPISRSGDTAGPAGDSRERKEPIPDE